MEQFMHLRVLSKLSGIISMRNSHSITSYSQTLKSEKIIMQNGLYTSLHFSYM